MSTSPVSLIGEPSVATDEARIGPNAVLQTLRALEARAGAAVAERVARQARLPDPLPPGMIPEAWFVRLVAATRRTLGPDEAERVLRRSGALTADYVAAHRIPGLFKALLRCLPTRWSVPLLLFAFRRHAWTFAGSSAFSVARADHGAGFELTLDDCPTCRHQPGEPRPGGAYYEAAFEGLLRLAGRNINVQEVSCRLRGDDVCRFSVTTRDEDRR